MNELIDAIRQLLDKLEAVSGHEREISANPGLFGAAEMPIVIQEIVDDLHPLLTPYEIAFYWHLFRHSIARSGSPLVRVSRPGLRGVAKSTKPGVKDKKLSEAQVRTSIRVLESMGVIRNEGDPNRDGTLYRVLIPDEIEACREFRRKRAAHAEKPQPSEGEVDFYNVKENRIKVYERDNYKCRYCSKQLTRFTCSLDHVTPVAAGGRNNLENLVTACLDCNSRKHQRPVGDFLAGA